MAEDVNDSERTESPTQKRLDDARAKGQVPRSRDLSAAAVVLAGGLGLRTLGSQFGGNMVSLMRESLTFTRDAALDNGWMLHQFERSALQGALAMAPLLCLLLAAAVLAPLAIGGWTFSGEALVPDFGRLNPAAGLGRVFSVRGLIELSKALARFIVVAIVAVALLWKQFHSFNQLELEPTGAAVAHAVLLAGTALIALGGALAAIAMVDVPLALWQFNKQMRMTRQEIREEHKETEGSPEIKSRVRRTQQAMARKRMMQQVPKASVVITNPTHFAVALQYDESRMRAPIVVAKGRDLVAARIREIAAEHNVALVEAPPLARALHASCELGDEIPARLYAAVAKILVYVYQLRTARGRGEPSPVPPSIELPEQGD
ncbi:MAG TPA: flagellar biosynthesis protein FlhB [Steroidobacteraceae bacterium]|jgi:flagellar biosynthetic protein FlhB|nr:flagellar biosynthesis protein FlhB [Steroidobacteraceae bacterium]